MVDEHSGRFEHLSRYMVSLELAGFEQDSPVVAPIEQRTSTNTRCARCHSAHLNRRRFIRDGGALTINVCLDCGYFEPL